jgi:hypothetical protein
MNSKIDEALIICGQSRIDTGEVLALPIKLNAACPAEWRICAAKKHSLAETKSYCGNACEYLNIGLGRDGNAV